MEVYTICGSMRFAKEMKRIAWDLETKKGICVLQCTYDEEKNNESLDELAKVYASHMKKIDLSDAIYVVNIGGYIGESTRSEITYAQMHGKDIIYHEKLKNKTIVAKKAQKEISKAEPKKRATKAAKEKVKTKKKLTK